MPVDPRLLQPSIAFRTESEQEALGRYTGFGARVFPLLWQRFPELRSCFQFFRDPRSNDVWSYCVGPECEFGMQLDPDIEVICLWDSLQAVEIGTWTNDAVADALKWIADRYVAG